MVLVTSVYDIDGVQVNSSLYFLSYKSFKALFSWFFVVFPTFPLFLNYNKEYFFLLENLGDDVWFSNKFFNGELVFDNIE